MTVMAWLKGKGQRSGELNLEADLQINAKTRIEKYVDVHDFKGVLKLITTIFCCSQYANPEK